jgi:hypothetical protein
MSMLPGLESLHGSRSAADEGADEGAAARYD